MPECIWLLFSLSVMPNSVTPWTAACWASPVHYLQEFAQTHVHRVDDAVQPSHPLSPPSPLVLNLSQSGSFPISRLLL